MRIEPVRSGLYRIWGFTNGNIVAAVGRKGVLLVDGQSARRVGLADSALRTVTDLPVRYVINTHSHDDHIGGNPHWKALGATVFGQLGQAWEAKRDTVIPELSWHHEAADPAALADSGIKESKRFSLDGQGEIVAFHVPHAHTASDLVVLFKRANVIHTGDLVELEAPPFIDLWAGGSLDGMIAGVDQILAIANDRTIIVPGHGPPIGKREVEAYRRTLAILRDRVRGAVSAGKSMADVVAEGPADEFTDQFGGVRRRMPRFVRLLYLDATRAEAARRISALQERLRAIFDSVRSAGSRFPGATVGLVFSDSRTMAWATGQADTTLRQPLHPTDLLLAGSVGKTFVAGVALDLVQEGKLDLDQKISHWLGQEPWFSRLPNGPDITVRELMNHTSGLVRYEFKDEFTRDLTASPDKTWKPEELVSYILGTTAPFPAGQGWDYSDTNYIILGMILERITGHSLYGEVRDRILQPLALTRVRPSDSRRMDGLVQGYAGADNPFGGTDAMIRNGEFAINPQFEWAGGGFAASAEDLARWAQVLWSGRAFPDSIMRQVFDGVPARLGPGAKYGLGVIIRPTPLGVSYGHSGFFPGYLTEVRYYPDAQVAVAVQFNSSAPGTIRGLGQLVDELGKTATTSSPRPALPSAPSRP